MAFSGRSMMVVETFARGLGLPPVLAEDGSCSFDFARSGTLSLMSSDDGDRVLVSLAWMPHYPEIARDRRLLDLAGQDELTQSFIHCGKAPDGSLVLALGLEEERFDEQSLDAALRRLIDLQASVQ